MKYIIVFFITFTFIFSCEKVTWEPKKSDDYKHKNVSELLLEKTKGSINPISKKRFLLINFTEYYCKPCFEEIPDLNELYDEYKNEEIGFISFYTKDSVKLFNNISKVGGFKFDLVKVSSDETRMELCRIYSEQQDLILDKCTLPSTFLVDLKEDSILFRQLGKFKSMDKITVVLNKIIN